MGTYEGLWDCPNCQNKGNKGHDKHCGGCGAPRGDGVEFYLPDDAREVTDDAELQRSELGPDWTCAYCQGDNRADCKFCTNCGAGADGSKPRAVKEERFPEKSTPGSGLVTDPVEYGSVDRIDKPASTPFWKKATGCAGCLGCLGVLLVVILIASWMSSPRSASLQIVGHAWRSVINTEHYGPVEESAWDNAVPMGATVISRQRQVMRTNHIATGSVTRHRHVQQRVQHGTEKVKVGKKNMGNGYFKDIYEDRPVYAMVDKDEPYQETAYRDDPVYGTKVFYRIGRWTTGPPVTLQGNDLNPRWPDFNPNGSLRQANRQQVFQVLLTDSSRRHYSYTAGSENEWRSLRDGQRVKGKVSGDTVQSIEAR